MLLSSATLTVTKAEKGAVLDLLSTHESIDEVVAATIHRSTRLPRFWAVAVPVSIPLAGALLQTCLQDSAPAAFPDWVTTCSVSVAILLVNLYGGGPQDIKAVPRKEGPRSFTIDRRLRDGDVVQLTYMAEGHRLHV